MLLIPYLLFNLTEYHALSGARAAAALIKSVVGVLPNNFTGVKMIIDQVHQTIFIGQGLVSASVSNHYQRLWEWTALITAVAALAGPALRGRRNELAVMSWIVVSIPLGIATLILAGFQGYGNQASVWGRYLDCMLPLFAILVAYGAVSLLGSRLGSLALLSAMVVGTFEEASIDQTWVRATYTADVIGRSVPVVEQSYADSAVSTASVRASATCPVNAVALDVIGAPPPVVSIDAQRSPLLATDGVWTEYGLPQSVRGNLNVEFPTPVSLGTARHLGSLSTDSGRVPATSSGVPSIRIYCPVPDPATARFEQLYNPNHLPISFGTLLAWPEAEAWVGVALTASVALGVAWSLLDRSEPHHRRRRPSPISTQRP